MQKSLILAPHQLCAFKQCRASFKYNLSK